MVFSDWFTGEGMLFMTQCHIGRRALCDGSFGQTLSPERTYL